MTTVARRFIPIYLPDQRGVEISAFGQGNVKIGPNVFTYSRRPGAGYTCPGATDECERVCYAKRVDGIVQHIWDGNTWRDHVPELPAECRLLRLHIGGDFDTVPYIDNWIGRLTQRADVTCWAYTRSWRVPTLLQALERLRALPNVQLFASMDKSTRELPPAGWRRAWIDGDPRCAKVHLSARSAHNRTAFDESPMLAAPSYVCPEQTGRKTNCQQCRYCFDGRRGDVTFLEH